MKGTQDESLGMRIRLINFVIISHPDRTPFDAVYRIAVGDLGLFYDIRPPLHRVLKEKLMPFK